jgi:two-component system, response regulator YesN
MTTIMLVDDEPFIRESVKALVAWEEYGFSIVYETYNGKEALAFLETTPVDIIITDIKMPVMDGLELIEQVHLRYPNIRFVVLSAFDEFPLVKRAFKIGVQDYLLKSEMEEDEVIATMNKIQKEIDDHPNDTSFAKTYLEDHPFLLGEHIFERILGGENDTFLERREKIQQLEQIGLTLTGVKYFVLLLTTTGGVIPEPLLFSILQNYSGCFYMGYREKTRGILFTFPNDTPWPAALSVIETFFKTVAERTTDTGGEHGSSYSVTAGLSSEGRGMEAIVNSYRQASVALKYSFLRGKGKIVKFTSISDEKGNQKFDPEVKAREFRTLVNRQDFTALTEKREWFCIKTIHLAPSQIDQVKRLFVLYSFYISDFFDRYSFPGDTAVHDKIKEFNEIIRTGGDLDDHNRWLISIINTITEVVCGKSQLIHNAVRYIHDHLHEEISLGDIAGHLQVSEPYLSRKFSGELGVRLSHFISKIKMEKAAELLKNSTLKIYEISEMVGYTNPEHFSRVFKRIMGKSPKQFTVK